MYSPQAQMCTAIRVLMGVREKWNGIIGGVVKMRGNKEEEKRKMYVHDHDNAEGGKLNARNHQHGA